MFNIFRNAGSYGVSISDWSPSETPRRAISPGPNFYGRDKIVLQADGHIRRAGGGGGRNVVRFTLCVPTTETYVADLPEIGWIRDLRSDGAGWDLPGH